MGRYHGGGVPRKRCFGGSSPRPGPSPGPRQNPGMGSSSSPNSCYSPDLYNRFRGAMWVGGRHSRQIRLSGVATIDSFTDRGPLRRQFGGVLLPDRDRGGVRDPVARLGGEEDELVHKDVGGVVEDPAGDEVLTRPKVFGLVREGHVNQFVPAGRRTVTAELFPPV